MEFEEKYFFKALKLAGDMGLTSSEMKAKVLTLCPEMDIKYLT
jgi:hypothetical protein